MKRRYEIILEIDSDETDVSEIIRNKFKFDFKTKILDIKNVKEARSSQQNKALHKYFSLLAEELNSKHFDMRAIIRQEIEIGWTGYTIKEYLFKPLLHTKFGKISTTQLFKSGEIDDLVDIITKVIAERTKGECDYISFPSWENL